MDAVIAQLERVERARDALLAACGSCDTCVRIISDLERRARELTRAMYTGDVSVCKSYLIVVD